MFAGRHSKDELLDEAKHLDTLQIAHASRYGCVKECQQLYKVDEQSK